MATKYTKSVSVDFSGGVNQAQLHQEIATDVGIAPAILRVDITGDVVDIWFDAALDAGEQTTLDGLVAAHTPYSTITTQLDVNETVTTLTTKDGYIQKARLSAINIAAGTYYLNWGACIRNTEVNKPVLYRIQCNDTVTLLEAGDAISSAYIPWKAISGIVKIDITAGTHYFDFDYGSTPEGGNVEIKDVLMTISSSI